jgi:hypothetical protein
MTNTKLKYGIAFIFLVLIQVLIFNNNFFSGYINPVIYIFFIFIYPLDKEKMMFLIISFFLGLSVDVFSNSGGINAAATLFIAYVRLPVLHLILNKPEFDYLLFNVKKLTLFQGLSYIFSLTFIHQFIVYALEHYKLHGFLFMLQKTFFATILSTIIIGFSLMLFLKSKK